MDETNGALPPVVVTSGTNGNGLVDGNLIEVPVPRSAAAIAAASAMVGDGNSENVPSSVDVQQQMIALQQAFQQKQADLLYHFQQSQAQLALQHYQLSQQLLRDAARRQEQLEAAAAAAAVAAAADRELQRIASNHIIQQQANMYNNHGGNNGQNLMGVSASEYDLSRAAAGGSGAISLQTRAKLKAHLANKQRSRRRSTQGGSPHFEPYPVPNNCVVDDDPGSVNASDDYDLRKTRSEPNLKILPPRGALHHHHNAAALRAKILHQQQQQHNRFDHGSAASAMRPLNMNEVIIPDKETTPEGITSAAAVVQQQQQAAAAAAALSAFFTAPSMPNISAFHQNRSSAFLSTGLPAEPISSAIGGPLFFSVPSMLPYLNAAALQQAAAAVAAASGGGAVDSTLSQADGRPLFDFAGGGGLVEGNRRTLTSAFSSHGHSSHGSSGSHGLLKQQLRDLLLRRRSLVPEETADELKSETIAPTSSSSACIPPQMVSKNCIISQQAADSVQCSSRGTGLAYDNLMCKHQCICGDNSQHVEHGGRVQSIWARLQETGLADDCEKISGRKAPVDYLKLCHGDSYTTFFAVSPSACLKFDVNELPLKTFVQLPCGGIGIDSDTYFNDAFTPSAARLAVGCCVELCAAVVEGRLKNGFAIVRPPGHHAEPDQALGFCFFNNVAIAAQVLRKKYGVRKVAIVDWDVHHGNGTQLIFEEDPNVLYLSFHRHDDGNFFPGTGAITDVGVGVGRGATINVAWSGEPMGDAEYLAAWRVIALPILDRFQPDFVLVSAGFDAANGHRAALGGYKLSSSLFGYFTKSLVSRYANGKVVLVLEGGYDLAVISEAAEQCVRALKEGANNGPSGNGISTMAELPPQSLTARPNLSAQQTLARVVEVQRVFWPSLTADGATISQSEWLSNLPRQFASLTMDTSNTVHVKEECDEPLEIDEDVELVADDDGTN